MYSFEGQYRRLPEQLLGGDSVNVGRQQLLQRAQERRQLRRQLQQREQSATRIQSFVRGCLARSRLRRIFRDEYDRLIGSLGGDTVSTPPAHHELMRACALLCWLYCDSCAKDSARFVALGRLLLLRQQLPPLQLLHQLHQLRYGRLLLIAARCTHIESCRTVALRLLEECLSSTTSITPPPPPATTAAAAGVSCCSSSPLLVCLARGGYWRQLRLLLDRRVPPLDEDMVRPPVLLAELLLQLVLAPLEAAASSASTSTSTTTTVATTELLTTFVTQFLAPPLSPQLRHFILPALASSVTSTATATATASHRFPFGQLLDVLSCNSNSLLVAADGVRDSLLYVLLRLAAGSSGGGGSDSCWDSTTPATATTPTVTSAAAAPQLSPVDTVRLMALVGVCCRQWHSDWCATTSHAPSSASTASATTNSAGYTPVPSLDTDSDSDSDSGGGGGDLDNATLAVLNSGWLVRLVMAAVRAENSSGGSGGDGSRGEDTLVVALSWLCYRLLHCDRLAVHRYRLLYTLAFSPHFLARLWPQLQRSCMTVESSSNCQHQQRAALAAQLATFCALLGHVLPTVRDEELAGGCLYECCHLVTVSALLRDVFLDLLHLVYRRLPPSSGYTALAAPHTDSSASATGACSNWRLLLRSVGVLLWQLQARDCRLHFCPPGHWSHRQQPLPAERLGEVARLFCNSDFNDHSQQQQQQLQQHGQLPASWSRDLRSLLLLRQLPFVFSFEQRVQLFQELLRQDRAASQSELDHFMASGLGSQIQLTVRRDYLYEDAFDKLSPDNEPTLKPRMRVAMINAKGLDEAGVDGGGIFREFLSELLKTAFNPNRGFFCATTENQLYPNPHVDMLFDNADAHYFFIGRLLGKALYEQLLVELPLAAFFLVKLLGRRCDSVDLHYLQSLDPQLYRSLVFLMSGQAPVSELGLDFSVSVTGLGTSRLHELRPGGSSTPVTDANCVEYVHLMADFKLNGQIRRQCAWLRRGLADVLPLDWLQMFDHTELQTLVAGAAVPVDVDDLRAHTQYGGAYTADHPVVVRFWRVVAALSQPRKALLLRFVTSCSRPPLLGFAELQPPFCVHSAGQLDRLPSASTCMHLLKLPEYDSDQLLHDRLVYAIEAQAGFELS